MVVSQRKLVRLLVIVAALLAFFHVVAMVAYYRGFLGSDDWIHIAFFDLDEEEAFGTWFSTMLLMLASLLLAVQAHICKTESNRWVSWWLALSVGFLILSIDEVVAFHEYVNTVVEDTRWTTFAVGLVLIVGLAYLPFLRALPPRSRTLFIVAGVLYIGGAVGVERATDWYDDQELLDTLGYNLWTAVEEVLEISGVTLFIYAVIGHICDNADGHAIIRITMTD